MSTEAVHLIVRGKVQGVYYRAYTQELAVELGLSGWVQNCPDGTVEICAEGAKSQLDKLITWCRKGPPAAKVEDVAVKWVTPENTKLFEIRRG